MRRGIPARAMAAVIAPVLLLATSIAVARTAEERAPDPAGSAVEQLQSLGLPLEQILRNKPGLGDLLGMVGLKKLRVPDGVRVLLVSSGVDGAMFGEELAPHFTGADGDRIGLGTYAASVLLQVAPNARITSRNVFDGERVSRGAVDSALGWAAEHAADLDVVVLAFPPSETLDPTSAAMTPDSANAADWLSLRKHIAALRGDGVTVVVPAGDLGPKPQTVLGIAGLPEVVTVGALDGGGVTRTSSTGPSLHGGMKPDLVAPSGIGGLVPEKSVLAKTLAAVDALDLPLPAAPAGGRRVIVGSTIPAAVLVGAQVAHLRASGVSDPSTVRGTLAAASEPLAGEASWRQGAGALRQPASAQLARSRPLVGGNPDLFGEPAAGRAWSASVPIVNGRGAGSPRARMPNRLSTSALGQREATTAPAGAQPRLAVDTSNGILGVSLPAGDNPWDGGAYCGYLEVPLVGAVSVVEDVPLCLVEGLTHTAFNFYIHDMPAENLTWALEPALPPGLGLLDGPLMLLPLNPLHEPLLAGVSGPSGLVRFTNVPPTFFTMRQFSDYGSPVTEPALGRDRDLGETASYLTFDALVLPNPCAETIQENWRDGTPCHESWLRERFGDNVEYDRTNAIYRVDGPTGRLGIVFDFSKKSPGVAVASRYVDLLSHGSLQHGSAVNLERLKPTLDQLGLQLADAWTFAPAAGSGESEGTQASFSGFGLGKDPSTLVGASNYPFSLTTPNYTGTMSLNFTYELANALMAVVVRVHDEAHATVFTPEGSITLPSVSTEHPLEPHLAKLVDVRAATGVANLEIDLKPGGADRGTLSFVYVPINPAEPASVKVADRSFEITTWQRIDWPPAMLERPGHTDHMGHEGMVMGHVYHFDSNYNTRQMDHPACRRIDNGRQAADVCENWQVMVHSPLDDAETFALKDMASDGDFMPSMRAAGAAMFNPHRGVHGNREALLPDLIGVGIPLGTGVVTNGRFWEQLVVPTNVLRAHPGEVEVDVVDNDHGGMSPLLPHRDGAVPLAPYVPFQPAHSSLSTEPVTGSLPSVGELSEKTGIPLPSEVTVPGVASAGAGGGGEKAHHRRHRAEPEQQEGPRPSRLARRTREALSPRSAFRR